MQVKFVTSQHRLASFWRQTNIKISRDLGYQFAGIRSPGAVQGRSPGHAGEAGPAQRGVQSGETPGGRHQSVDARRRPTEIITRHISVTAGVGVRTGGLASSGAWPPLVPCPPAGHQYQAPVSLWPPSLPSLPPPPSLTTSVPLGLFGK